MSTASSLAFHYQGQLMNGSSPAQGTYDFRFMLYSAASNGVAAGSPVTNLNVAVANGIFVCETLFEDIEFTGQALWMEIGVRPSGSFAFTVLSPRQALSPVPEAYFARRASAADSSVRAASLVEGAVNEAALASGAVTADKIATNQVVRSLNGLREDIVLTAGANIVLGTNQDGLSISAPDFVTAGTNGWSLRGNAGTTPDQNFLGTTDNRPLLLAADGKRALQLEASSKVLSSSALGSTTGSAINVLGGSSTNQILGNTIGATIAGGGYVSRSWPTGLIRSHPNQVTDDFGTVGGGYGNQAADRTTVAGGAMNTALSAAATISGGMNNAIATNADYATIPGGRDAYAAHYGQIAYASGHFAEPGDAQASIFVLRGVVTNSSGSELFLDGVSRRIQIPKGTTWTLDILAVARGSAAGPGTKKLSAGFKLLAVVGREEDGTYWQEVLRQLNGDGMNDFSSYASKTGWGFGIVQNNSNLKIIGIVNEGETSRWVAEVRAVQVAY
jgi:hypothetical protein